jgi:hypothetical protein
MERIPFSFSFLFFQVSSALCESIYLHCRFSRFFLQGRGDSRVDLHSEARSALSQVSIVLSELIMETLIAYSPSMGHSP